MEGDVLCPKLLRSCTLGKMHFQIVLLMPLGCLFCFVFFNSKANAFYLHDTWRPILFFLICTSHGSLMVDPW